MLKDKHGRDTQRRANEFDQVVTSAQDQGDRQSGQGRDGDDECKGRDRRTRWVGCVDG